MSGPVRSAGTRALLVALALSGCGGEANDAGAGRGDGGTPGEAAGMRIASDSVSTHPVMLVNPRVYPVIVLGSAGAREVLLDTVAAGDSSRLDVQVSSDLLKLRAIDLEGNELGSGFLQLPEAAQADSVATVAPLRWVLPRSQ